MWSAESGECLLTFWGHSAEVVKAEFSPSPELMATASMDYTARTYNMETGNFQCVSMVIISMLCWVSNLMKLLLHLIELHLYLRTFLLPWIVTIVTFTSVFSSHGLSNHWTCWKEVGRIGIGSICLTNRGKHEEPLIRFCRERLAPRIEQEMLWVSSERSYCYFTSLG